MSANSGDDQPFKNKKVYKIKYTLNLLPSAFNKIEDESKISENGIMIDLNDE